MNKNRFFLSHKSLEDDFNLLMVALTASSSSITLTNAIKYSPDAKNKSVHLSTTVTDLGLGIKEEDQKKIFERFYRVDSVQRVFPGMGIGLYVCEQIIKSHQGSLWVESEEGKGATFSFTLPYLFTNQNENNGEIQNIGL